MGWFQRIFWGLAAGGGIYVAALLALTHPDLQRGASYAHKVNPAKWQNLSNVDQFGFFHHQVQPFTFRTPDNHTIFAWHILPTHLYRQHAEKLKANQDFGVRSFENAAVQPNLRLLFDDPKAHLVVSFHGNAGHLASAQRPATYQNILATSTVARPVHVIAFDYRGFGLSEGSPNEPGVIQDGVTLLSLLTGYDENGVTAKCSSNVASKLDPSRVVLLGQSMGTFISSAVFEDWAIRLRRPSFKGLMLFASFGDLTNLLESYSIKGFTPPLLSPLIQYPTIQKWFMSKIVDKWDTRLRLRNLISAKDLPFDVTIMHAKDDWEIPWHEGKRNWEAIIEAAEGKGQLTTTVDDNIDIGKWNSDDKRKRVTWERIRHGGHNRIPTSEQAKVAVIELLDR